MIASTYGTTNTSELLLELSPLEAALTYEINRDDPLTISFTGEILSELSKETGNESENISWKWEFGDDSTDIGQNVTHAYRAPGEKNVTLTVADGDQEVNITESIIVHAPPMYADFAVTLPDAKHPLTVSFLDRSYGPIESWEWYFGDGASSSEQNPVHTFSEAGEYTTQLIITSTHGITDMQQVRFIIPGTLDSPTPRAASTTENIGQESASDKNISFIADVYEGAAPLFVSFKDTSDYEFVRWHWDFGDRKQSPLQNPVHVFTTPGRYLVIFKAETVDGAVLSANAFVTVTR
jgi:PKD repeat protein